MSIADFVQKKNPTDISKNSKIIVNPGQCHFVLYEKYKDNDLLCIKHEHLDIFRASP